MVLLGVAAEAVQRAINDIIGIMTKKRTYFCFDFDEDQGLKHHMVGQIKLPDSPFEGADWSMKEAALQQNWEAEAEARIRRSDVVVVLVGEKTHKAPGVV